MPALDLVAIISVIKEKVNSTEEILGNSLIDAITTKSTDFIATMEINGKEFFLRRPRRNTYKPNKYVKKKFRGGGKRMSKRQTDVAKTATGYTKSRSVEPGVANNKEELL